MCVCVCVFMHLVLFQKPEPCREMDTATSVEDHTHKDTMEVSEEGMSCDPDPSSSKGKKSKKKRKHKEKTVKEEDSSKQQSSTEDEPVAKKAKKLKKKKKSHDTESSVIVSDGEGCEEEMDGLVLKTASNSETKCVCVCVCVCTRMFRLLPIICVHTVSMLARICKYMFYGTKYLRTVVITSVGRTYVTTHTHTHH